jgi:hypothetical protein
MAMIMPSAHEVSLGLEELNHGGATHAIGSERIFNEDDNERSVPLKCHLSLPQSQNG